MNSRYTIHLTRSDIFKLFSFCILCKDQSRASSHLSEGQYLQSTFLNLSSLQKGYFYYPFCVLCALFWPEFEEVLSKAEEFVTLLHPQGRSMFRKASRWFRFCCNLGKQWKGGDRAGVSAFRLKKPHTVDS